MTKKVGGGSSYVVWQSSVAAQKTLAARQERYKRAYDRHVQSRNARLQVEDYVLVKVYAESSKLTLPLAGPYEVRRIDTRNGIFEINTAQRCVKVPSDRVRPAPIPRDLLTGRGDERKRAGR
jgi:hypothetical protein